MTTSFLAYLRQAADMIARNPEWRAGQVYYNALFEVRPDLANLVDDRHDLDPFYRDDVLTGFLAFMRGQWDKQPPAEVKA